MSLDGKLGPEYERPLDDRSIRREFIFQAVGNSGRIFSFINMQSPGPGTFSEDELILVWGLKAIRTGSAPPPVHLGPGYSGV
jgi:hypothetical protein